MYSYKLHRLIYSISAPIASVLHISTRQKLPLYIVVIISLVVITCFPTRHNNISVLKGSVRIQITDINRREFLQVV